MGTRILGLLFCVIVTPNYVFAKASDSIKVAIGDIYKGSALEDNLKADGAIFLLTHTIVL
ncbi:hypothetical protein [Vibrio aquimaris]|uniref:Uncharacterized protein n=1 Tax=Vibrio aquimaris TaxID=2587862 RepID=A0A5P9CK98_9VIBR|nr:hypothetical protein [Vibrio aquimaris]QFT26665.1 hypothetical protein FIV01_09515 [Vibrio aquimaris]